MTSADSIFNTSPRFSKAIEFINKVDEDYLYKLLPRFCEKLCLKEGKAFTSEECAKIQSTLSLDTVDTELLLETVEFIFQQAAYYGMKGKFLGRNLLLIDMDESKCKLFVEVWNDYNKTVVESMRKYSFATKQLSRVDWHMGIQLSQDTKTEQKKTNALLHLNLLNNATQKYEKVDLEFTHEELLKFYEKLEVLQMQLDALS